MLRRIPVSVSVRYYEKEDATPCDMVVTVFQSAKTPTPELVAKEYETALSENGVLWSKRSPLPPRTEHTFDDESLNIVVYPGWTPKPPTKEGPKPIRVRNIGDLLEYGAILPSQWIENLVFPPPRWIKNYYEALLDMDECKRFRGRPGPPPEPDNLIPACVASLLQFWTRRSRKEVHKLLNEHVLRETWKKLPEGGYSSSATNKLWRDAEKFKGRLLTTFEAFAYPYSD